MTNNEKKLKDQVDTRLSNLNADPYLFAKVKACANNPECKKSRKTRNTRRILTPVFTLMLCAVIGLTVAANRSYFNIFIDRMGADAQHQLTPVLETSQNNGINVEVLAAVSDEESIEVYIAVNDVYGLGRIDENSRIRFDVDGINMVHSQPYADLTHYDANTGVATFRLSILNAENENLKNKNITLNLMEILSGEDTYINSSIGVDISRFAETSGYTVAKEIPAYSILWGTKESISKKIIDDANKQNLKILNPNTPVINNSVPDWMEIKGIGLIDDYLHIQYYINNDMRLNMHPQFSFYSNGQKLNGFMVADIELSEPEEIFGYNSSRLRETILEIPHSYNISNLTLGVECTTYSIVVDEMQTIDFKLPKKDNVRIYKTNLQIENATVNEIHISPIGISVYGTEPQSSNTQFFIEAFLEDGSAIETYGSSAIFEHSNNNDLIYFTHKINYSIPLEPDKIRQISINGDIIDLN